ncbi:endoplasmic reticulum membrane sensor NFE2L1a isoform X1 [Solea solea]|uniref:endoplasmic reticulum membrane sensor NFE2L1a isoform X1 n=1 Tax=Solea solea TaxID=90069 RepID=UPI00272BE14D|nr:endoplasmic reticulum membrane sensor NFE2L1a isoform X1 [Solea solea]
MLYLKKYFTEGLIQVAILLSLCGVMVDVGLEPYLPPAWHDMILGPTSALTQTHFHNLRNSLEDGQGLHTKNVDVDGFFTTRRLLGWVRSLDRLQIPRSELETWLVQREPDPLPMGCQDQPSLLERVPTGMERDRSDVTVEPTSGHGEEEEGEEVEEGDKEEENHHVLTHSGDVDEREEEEGDEEENMSRMHRHCRRRTTGTSHAHFTESTQNELEQTSVSLQECLRLLEETFPFTEEQQLGDGESRRGERRPQEREPLLSPVLTTENPSLDMELRWQDLFAIMEPGNTDVDMTSSFDQTMDSNPSGTQGVESEALNQDCNNLVNGLTGAGQEVQFMESSMQQDFLWSPRQPEREPPLLPLTPSAELDDYNSTLSSMDVLNTVHRPPDHLDVLGEEPSKEFCSGNSGSLNANLLTQDVDNVEGGLFPEGGLASLDVNFQLRSLTPSSPVSSLEGSDMNQNLLMAPPSVFLVDEEDVGDEDYLPDQLGDLLEDAAILDEMRLMDLALEEGFSPEMAARLEEEGYFGCEVGGRDEDHSVPTREAVTEDQSQTERQPQDADNEADSDSGLSLNFSYSPTSPCASEASYCSSSSSSSSSTSASSYVSGVESPYSEVKDEDAEEGLSDLNMELDINIKQEPEDEEEMGAVGGVYPEDFKKLFPVNYDNHKLLNDMHWMEHIEHDHTYNQPRSTISSPPLDNIPSKHTKSSPQHHKRRPVHSSSSSSSRHMSEARIRSRDERRARALKVPFSNDLIVNLPVEEFNDLLTNCHLNEQQLALVRDIRRRGKNKIAAQNCRKRKLDVLMGLEDNVSGLRRRRLRLLREKQEALRNLQEMKRRLGNLYQDVFSRLRDEEGRPLDSTEYFLNFEHDGSVMVASHQQETWMPLRGEKTSKKQRNNKKK